jgi:catechol 2,3-dioxygenase-like lactoylglutathione lyase family enzyme
LEEHYSHQEARIKKPEESIERAHNFILISIPVSDVEQSFKFYVEKLGFEPKRQPDKYGNAIVRIGESPDIFLCQQQEDQSREPNVGRKGIGLEVGTKDIEQFYAQLKSEDVKVGERYDNPGCGRYFDVYDPDGNKVTVCQDWYNRF